MSQRDFDTVLRRLDAKNAALDRKLACELERLGLSPEAFAQIAALAATRAPDAVRQCIVNTPDNADREWARITRPSAASLSATTRGRLIRA